MPRPAKPNKGPYLTERAVITRLIRNIITHRPAKESEEVLSHLRKVEQWITDDERRLLIAAQKARVVGEIPSSRRSRSSSDSATVGESSGSTPT